MDYFASLDISMDETHICVLDREGAVVYESKSASMANAIPDELSPDAVRTRFSPEAAPATYSPSREVGITTR